MASIEIDNQTYTVNGGDNLLKTVLSLGLNLPYFCWHPAMGSVGACRQCAVMQYQDKQDQRGRMVMACMTPVSDGMLVSLEAPTAREFRSYILELLMTNHPHDCPVCEEGGECHLQDMTVMTGHTVRKYCYQKRTHRNQYLGPFINHEMNRCIACYRCVRYYQDYAGGDDLQVFAAHNHVYFGRHEDGVLENEFSGNLVEVCPTGVFTDKTFSQHYTRKWDLQSAPSICVHCALGCNTSPGERYGELRRIQNRYNGNINGYFLCDRGRFGYGFVNSEKRIRDAYLDQQVVNQEQAQQHFGKLLKNKKGIIGIGSPRASVEANFALRELVGTDNFYQGVDERQHQLLALVVELLDNSPAKIASLREVEQADAVIILGEDLPNTAPRLALSVRQAIRNRSYDMAEQLHLAQWQDAAIRELAQDEKSPLFVACCQNTRLDDIAEQTLHGSPEDIARFGFALAHQLHAEAPAVNDLTKAELENIQSIAAILRKAKKPLVITGTSCQHSTVINAAVNLVKSLPAKDKTWSLVVPECNSIGLALLGGDSFLQAAGRIKSGEVETVVVLENDLYRRGAKEQIDDYLSSVKHLVVIDHISSNTTERGELVLPAATFAETEGTLINSEGRAQRYFAVYPAAGAVQDSWQWLAAAAENNEWLHADDITAACCTALPVFKPIADAAPESGFRRAGMKIPRQPHRYSGRTAMSANINVSEPRQPVDNDSALAFSMEGMADCRPPALNPIVWFPAWNSNQAVNKFQDEIGGHLHGGDPGVCLFTTVAEHAWQTTIPARPEPDNDTLSCVPLYHIFGSEELSMLAAPLAGRAPEIYAALHPDQAKALAIREGEKVELTHHAWHCRLPVKLVASLAPGNVGIPTGFPAVPYVAGQSQIKISKLK
jgi:NADH-quinone oxidoreductase subunit G